MWRSFLAAALSIPASNIGLYQKNTKVQWDPMRFDSTVLSFPHVYESALLDSTNGRTKALSVPSQVRIVGSFDVARGR